MALALTSFFNSQTRCFYFLMFFLTLQFQLGYFKTTPLYQPEHILDASESHCLVLLPQEALTTSGRKSLLKMLSEISFVNETNVLVGSMQLSTFAWPNGQPLKINGNPSKSKLENTLLVFQQVKKDRTCLLVPQTDILPPKAVYFQLPKNEIKGKLSDVLLDNIVAFVNSHCLTFRSKDGSINMAGVHRQYILQNIFQTQKLNVNIFSNNSEKENNFFKYCQKEDLFSCDKTMDKLADAKQTTKGQTGFQECERIPVPTSSQFFQEFVSLSKPVIITGAMDHWKASKKWTNSFLRANYGDRYVHIKITSDGIYEGVEPTSLWQNSQGIKIPKSVLEKLPYPDLVVVRPASLELKFSEFLDLMEEISEKKVNNISAYLEYSTIADYFPELREDITDMSFFSNILELKHLNIWLSDGNTLGKLHFDPFDNFLCQISGEKQLLLYEPHDNSRLYEAHIQEARLTYNKTSHTFHRKTLLESTSMVMSPVDITKPDLKRFPKFLDVQPLNCTIKAGEVLFMPAFWWHEVQSKPNRTEHRNLAVNFWYEPFLTREFPCPECPLDVNPKYYHLL